MSPHTSRALVLNENGRIRSSNQNESIATICFVFLYGFSLDKYNINVDMDGSCRGTPLISGTYEKHSIWQRGWGDAVILIISCKEKKISFSLFLSNIDSDSFVSASHTDCHLINPIILWDLGKIFDQFFILNRISFVWEQGSYRWTFSPIWPIVFFLKLVECEHTQTHITIYTLVPTDLIFLLHWPQLFYTFPMTQHNIGHCSCWGTTLSFAPAAAFAGEFPSNYLLLNTQSSEQHSRLSIPEGYLNGFYF